MFIFLYYVIAYLCGSINLEKNGVGVRLSDIPACFCEEIFEKIKSFPGCLKLRHDK